MVSDRMRNMFNWLFPANMMYRLDNCFNYDTLNDDHDDQPEYTLHMYSHITHTNVLLTPTHSS